MKKALVVITLLLLLFFFIILQDNRSQREVLFSVEKGESFVEIGKNLEIEGLVTNRFLFNIYLFLSGARKDLQAGTYLLSSDMSIKQIIDKIRSGEVYTRKFTVIEGWRAKDIADHLSEIGLDGDKFMAIVKRGEGNFAVLSDKPIDAGLEGYLFPDTYLLPYGIDEQGLIDMMLANIDSKIKKSDKNLFDIITMASIIEKEVRSEKDKRLVSGILWKRIEIGMPLQVDATIVYLTGKKSSAVSIEETKIDSPYNSYLYKGLPPGPISNPGLESILAALNPEPSNYLFYLSKPDGETVFNIDYQNHLIDKNRYLK